MNVKKSVQTIILTLNVILLGSCDPIDNRLVIFNKSSDTIFWYIRNSDEFPLTNEITNKPFYYRNLKGIESSYPNDYIAPMQKKNDEVQGFDGWEDEVKSSPDGKLRIFLFKKTLLDTTKWEYLVEKKIYSAKLEYTLDELNKVNWEIIYK